MTEGQRNIIIVIAIAVIGTLFFGDTLGTGAGWANLLLGIAFRVCLIWFLIVLYQRHSGTIDTMPSTPRSVMYVSGIVLLALLVSGLLSLLFVLFHVFARVPIVSEPQFFWPLLLVSIFGIWWSWQQRTSRW